MEVTVITIEHSLDETRQFGMLLNKALSVVKMLHWYAKDFNYHTLLGDLYEDLSDLFDKFQEEIIGTSKSEKVIFPLFSPNNFDTEDLNLFKGDHADLVDAYQMTSIKLLGIFQSREISNYIDSVTSGLNNTKEDILSRINKTNYLLGMIRDCN